MSISPLLLQVLRIAEEASDAIMAHYPFRRRPQFKKDRSPITDADRDAHRVILKGLRNLEPRTPILSEESRLPPASVRRTWKRFWLVDPLDGTRDFLNETDEFTVNIALVQGRTPVLGVVAAPALRRFYFAEKSSGSWLRVAGSPPRRLYGRPPTGRKKICLISRHQDGEALTKIVRGLPSAGIRRVGSSLKFCYLAEGRAHFYVRTGPTREWDVAAGDAVFRYAVRGKPRPSPFVYNKSDIINPPFMIGLEKPWKITPLR